MQELYRAPQKLYNEIGRYVNELEQSMRLLERLLIARNPEEIPILGLERRSDITLSGTLLHVDTFLQDSVWAKVKNAVLCSATLTVNNSFHYITKLLGLADFSTLSLESDFDYSTQALLFLPTDVGNFKDAWARAKIYEFMRDLIIAKGGRTLGLFTSFASIKESYLAINQPLKEAGIQLLSQ